ncbi:MAG: DUF2934 domain-containing protein [Candidatus Solibacter sp.]
MDERGFVDHPSPSNQQIEARAYQLWEERGHPVGSPEIDWCRAERELAEKRQGAASSLAREVGTALGTVMAFVRDAKAVLTEPSE